MQPKSAWPRKRLDACTNITRGASPRPIIDWITEDGTPWIKISDATLAPGRTIERTEEFIRKDGEVHSVLVQPGDLIVSNSATPGMPKFVGIDACIHDGWILFRDFRDLLPEFLYFRLLLDREYLTGQGNGSVFTNLKTSILKSHTLPLPPLKEQQKIVASLISLDDKITANRSLITATGQLTAAVFSKMTGHLPLASLSSYAQVNARSVKAGTGTLRYLDIASVGAGYYEYPTEIDWSVAPGRARRHVQRGDTVWSTVRPNRRSHALVLDGCSNLICSTGLATLTPKSPGFSFVFESSRTTAFTEYLIQNAKGSAYPAVNAARFADAPVPSASPDEVDAFNALCDPMWERAAGALTESRTLARLRDTLLPALMDGRLRVRDAAEQVESAL